MKRVLVIEPEPSVQDFLHRALQGEGFELRDADVCVNPEAPTDCPLSCRGKCAEPDLVILAVLVPRPCSGIEAAHKVLRQWPKAKVLLTSASPACNWPEDADTLLDALPRGSYSFLPKPFTAEQLKQAVQKLLTG